MSPEAGWYADPTDPSAVRWWDGAGWTAQTRPAPRELALAGAVASPSAAAVSASPAVEAPARSGPRHAAPSGRSEARATPAATPTPAPAPTPAPEHGAATAALSATPATGDDAAVDRSRPGARPPSAPVTPTAENAVVDRSRPGARPPAAPTASPLPADELLAAASDAADRSRPGARPAVQAGAAPATAPAQPVQPARPAAAVAAPAVTPSWVDGPASGGTTSTFGAKPNAFGNMPSAFSPGIGLDGGAGTPTPYQQHRGRRRLVIGLVLAVLIGGAGAAYGVPKFLATKASAQAAEQPDVLTHTAPKTLAGQKKVTVPGVILASVIHGLSDGGATWVWGQTYGARNAFTIYVASEVPDDQRPLAMRALRSHDAAQTLLTQVRAGLVDGPGQNTVVGDPTEYASAVAGKTWCMPVTVSGVSGGYCLWTSGKEMLQTFTLPGLQETAAKSTLAALSQMARTTTKAAASSSLVPKS